MNERGQVIQYDRFYIHEIQDLIDIRNDYANWFQQQVLGMVSSVDFSLGFCGCSPTVFCVCFIPLKKSRDSLKSGHFFFIKTPSQMTSAEQACVRYWLRKNC